MKTSLISRKHELVFGLIKTYHSASLILTQVSQKNGGIHCTIVQQLDGGRCLIPLWSNP